MIEIAPIVPAHIDSFHRTLDTMARERRYLAMLEAPPLENPRSFVQDNISQGHARFTALSAGEVVGWCDVTPKRLPIPRHIGVGVLPAYRDRASGVDGATT
jgi:hypothetical protein